MIIKLSRLFKSYMFIISNILKNPVIYLRYLSYDKLEHSYQDSFLKRSAFVNRAISKYKKCKYIEIGTRYGDTFTAVPLNDADKYGVDPDGVGNYKLLSDDFFKKYKNVKYDVAFIDGLHTYEQCKKDVINCCNHLKKDGVILMHDMLPLDPLESTKIQLQSKWCGDVWKVAFDLTYNSRANFFIINADKGIGVLKIKKNFVYKSIKNINKKEFNFYKKNYKKLKIISPEKALSFI